MTRSHTLSLLALALLATASPLAAASPARAQPAASSRAHADPAAEAFVQSEAQKILGVLNTRSLGLEEKKAAIRTFVNTVADVPRITSFVLGRYRRSLTPAQYGAFAAAFRDYADNVYESRLDEYRGQTLKVTGSLERAPGDVVVQSLITGAKGPPSQVDWRVLKEGDTYKVVDVNVAGVWLAITEQQDFVSTLDNHGGDVNFLISDLRRGETGASRR